MTADEIRKQKEAYAAAEPFADLAETARSMIIHLESVEACCDQVRNALLNHAPEDHTIGYVIGVRTHVLDDYAKARDELHAAIDRVMRSALVDKAATWTPPAPGPVKGEPHG